MSKTLAQIVSNVGNEVQDTSSTFAELIKTWVNRRYKQILQKANFQLINDSYTISLTAGTAEYTLPSDFGKEIACTDKTNSKPLERIDLQNLWNYYADSIETEGDVERYAIWTDEDGNQIIRFHYVPSEAITISLPYIIVPSDLSANSDTPLLPIDDLIELGVIADAWRYKRQGAKANDYETRFTIGVQDFIFSQENQPNKIQQFIPKAYSRDTV